MSNYQARLLAAVIVFAIGIHAAAFVWLNRNAGCVERPAKN